MGAGASNVAGSPEFVSAAFQKWDTDHSGFIDPDEFETALATLIAQHADKEGASFVKHHEQLKAVAKDEFLFIDKIKGPIDGKLSFEEFRHVMLTLSKVRNEKDLFQSVYRYFKLKENHDIQEKYSNGKKEIIMKHLEACDVAKSIINGLCQVNLMIWVIIN